MPSVDSEIRTRVAKLQRERPELSQLEAERVVLNSDAQLYKRYREEAGTPLEPTPQAPRLSAEPSGIGGIIMKRAQPLMAKGLSCADAISEVFRDDPALYTQYAKADSTPAPSFSSELLGHTLDLYGYYSALSSTLQGILGSEAGDKGAKIATALDDFKSAVLAQVRQAGVSVPTEKRAGDFIPASTQALLIKMAGELSPRDYQKGMQGIEAALQEIRGWVAERHVAST
jgi:hypothetical protein